ncbi:hypothetical protein BH11VER1_BH11VER1_40740 [soil metagenome]
MTPLQKFLTVGLIVASGATAYFWHNQQGEESSGESHPRVIEQTNTAPNQTSNNTLSSSEISDSSKAQNVSKAFPIACQTLARATVLPDEAVDTTGTALPKVFVDYLVDENSGHDQFVRGLPADSIKAFKTWGESVGTIGTVRCIEFMANNGVNEKPSTFDFLQYSTMRELIHEYPPAINGVAQADVAQYWKSISQSKNPVFRLLAINEVQRVIKDKPDAVALLSSRTGETDSTIVHALIDQLAIIGGDGGKVALTQIATNASSRGDQAISKAATDAIKKRHLGQSAY